MTQALIKHPHTKKEIGEQKRARKTKYAAQPSLIGTIKANQTQLKLMPSQSAAQTNGNTHREENQTTILNGVLSSCVNSMQIKPN